MIQEGFTRPVIVTDTQVAVNWHCHHDLACNLLAYCCVSSRTAADCEINSADAAK